MGHDPCPRGAVRVRRDARLRIDGATRMHRVWGWDVLACPNGTGRMRFLAVITQRNVLVRILTHVGLPAAPVVATPARRGDDTS